MKINQIFAGNPFFTTDATFPGDFVYYSEFVARLAKPMGSDTLDILHAAVGVSGESGELLDAVKKTWAYNKPLDRENVIEELGDLRFYMQHLMNVLKISEADVIEHNVRKLSKRYADGYSDKAAQERADKVEESVPVTNFVVQAGNAPAEDAPLHMQLHMEDSNDWMKNELDNQTDWSAS